MIDRLSSLLLLLLLLLAGCFRRSLQQDPRLLMPRLARNKKRAGRRRGGPSRPQTASTFFFSPLFFFEAFFFSSKNDPETLLPQTLTHKLNKKHFFSVSLLSFSLSLSLSDCSERAFACEKRFSFLLLSLVCCCFFMFKTRVYTIFPPFSAPTRHSLFFLSLSPFSLHLSQSLLSSKKKSHSRSPSL